MAHAVSAEIDGTDFDFTLGMHGAHWAMNAMAMLAAVRALGHDAATAGKRLVDFSNLPGRGAMLRGAFAGAEITLVDDSYNAGPASMAAAFATLAATRRRSWCCPTCWSSGDGSAAAHAALAPAVAGLRPRLVITIGPEMAAMAAALAGATGHVETARRRRHHPAQRRAARRRPSSSSRGRTGPAPGVLPPRCSTVSPACLQPTEVPRMLPELLVPLAGEYQFFNLFRYITFRTGGATITALILSLMFGPALIRWLKTHQAEGQPIRADGPESHLLTKVGTPTMGGLLILGAFALSTLLWMPLSNPYLWPVLSRRAGLRRRRVGR